MNSQKSFEQDGAALYLVPTPIGNLSEISSRIKESLEGADVIACEDTRNSGLLLSRINIKKPLIAHHEHNQKTSIEKILSLLEEGKKVAVISDAGYPLVSDPGAALVRAVIEKDIPVISMSGPNAAINALVASGLDCSHYTFYGFLSNKSNARKKELETLKEMPFTLIFYEAPHRIEEMLKDLLEVFGNRKICLARELTKLHEQYLRGTICEVLAHVEGLKGEMVVVVEGAPKKEGVSLEEALAEAKGLIDSGMKTKDAMKEIANKYSLSKNQLYNAYLKRRRR